MSEIKVLGGSVDKTLRWTFEGSKIVGRDKMSFSSKTVASHNLSGMEELSVASESAGVKVLGALGWGAVGTLVAGPVGTLVGGLLGGRGKTVTFVGKFFDGSTMLGQVPEKVWLKMISERI